MNISVWAVTRQRQVGFLIKMFIFFTLANVAFYRNQPWQDDLSLWLDSAGKSRQSARSLTNLGAAYIRLGRYEDAQKELTFAVKYARPYAGVHNNLGLAYDAMGMRDSAIAEYERALAMDSTYAAAKKNLVALYTDEAFIYGKRGDYSSSIAIFKKALSIEAENAAVLYGLALAHENIRDYDEAFRYWEMFVANAAQDDPFVETAKGRIERLERRTMD